MARYAGAELSDRNEHRTGGRISKRRCVPRRSDLPLQGSMATGGTLVGQTIEVRVDRPMCFRCKKVLPYIGLELGNPTVTFFDPDGLVRTMRDGVWVK